MEISNTTTERLRCTKFFLVRKLLLWKAPRANVVMGVFKDLWKPKVAVEAMAIGDFTMEDEVQCLLRGSPW